MQTSGGSRWMVWSAAFVVGAACACGAAESVGVVANVKVVSDKVKDVSSLEAWKQAYIKEGMTDKDKALACWESVVAHQYQDSPPVEFLNNENTVQDAIKMFNVYGHSFCGVAANELVSLARRRCHHNLARPLMRTRCPAEPGEN